VKNEWNTAHMDLRLYGYNTGTELTG